jgi:nucleoid DNA-binding protein
MQILTRNAGLAAVLFAAIETERARAKAQIDQEFDQLKAQLQNGDGETPVPFGDVTAPARRGRAGHIVGAQASNAIKLTDKQMAQLQNAIGSLDERLTPQQRAVLRARYIGNKSGREIAQELGLAGQWEVSHLVRKGLHALGFKTPKIARPRRNGNATRTTVVRRSRPPKGTSDIRARLGLKTR